MQTILASGHLITPIDLLALQYYLLETTSEWATHALKGMINKAVSTLKKDYFEIWRAEQTGNITMDYSIIIPAIIGLTQFKTYNVATPEMPIINRTEQRTILTCESGFSIEDWEKQALDAYYVNPEQYLVWCLENKISARRKAFLKETFSIYIADQESFPAEEDAYINYIANKAEYKDRTAREAEETPE